MQATWFSHPMAHGSTEPTSIPSLGAHRTANQSEITVIDSARSPLLTESSWTDVAGMFHVASSTDGGLYVTRRLRPKNLVPLAHVEHGWAITNELTLFGPDVNGVVQIPLDEMEQYSSLPFGVAILPDKSRIYVSSGRLKHA